MCACSREETFAFFPVESCKHLDLISAKISLNHNNKCKLLPERRSLCSLIPTWFIQTKS